MEKPYHIATPEEKGNWAGSSKYDLLMGPDGFECFLGELEDRSWSRDATKVVDELNRLYNLVIALKSGPPDGEKK